MPCWQTGGPLMIWKLFNACVLLITLIEINTLYKYELSRKCRYIMYIVLFLVLNYTSLLFSRQMLR